MNKTYVVQGNTSPKTIIMIPKNHIESLIVSLSSYLEEFSNDMDFKGICILHDGEDSSSGNVSASPILSSCSFVSYNDIITLYKQILNK